MRCAGCKAWKNEKCLAGVVPYESKYKGDGVGCSCNRVTVEKLMRERRTRYARLHNMSVEELAKWILRVVTCCDNKIRERCPKQCYLYDYCNGTGKESLEQWLMEGEEWAD